MKLSDLGEFGFIERIRPGSIVRPAHVACGIGDDCAVTRATAGLLQLVTTDLLIERVHFLREAMTPHQLGMKAMAVNLSDIAAMGGTPRDAYVSLAVPRDVTVAYLDGLYVGLKAMAERYGVNLLGGDTTGSKADLVVNVVVTGEVPEGEVLYRSGARPGDAIFVTGFLGDSGAGLDALLSGRALASDLTRLLVRRHLEPRPHLAEGRAIAASGLARAMIDVSDGLAIDLSHIADESGVGFEVEEARLPLSPELVEYSRVYSANAVALATGGGEDYVLIATGDPRLADVLAGRGFPITRIGTILPAGRREIVHRDGTREPLAPVGWDHFRRQG